MSPRHVALRTERASDTREVGATIARLLRPGDVVALTGELGAGKTVLVQGAAAALGVTGPVTSPTFTLVKTYAGALPLVHCDVYRLDRLQDVLDLGDDVMATEAVTFVEWGDAIEALLPPDRLEVELLFAPDAAATSGPVPVTDGGAGASRSPPAAGGEPGAHGGSSAAPRLLYVRGHGAWQPRMGELAAHCERWLHPHDGGEPAG